MSPPSLNHPIFLRDKNITNFVCIRPVTFSPYTFQENAEAISLTQIVAARIHCSTLYFLLLYNLSSDSFPIGPRRSAAPFILLAAW